MLRSLLASAESEEESPTEPDDEAIRAFWTSFANDEHALADGGVTVETVMALRARLAALSSALVPEIGDADASGKLMFAISADGISEYAPWAERVAAAAPALSGWSVRAFRPPKPLVDGEPCDPCPLPPDAVRFHVQPSEVSPGKLDLVLCLPDDVPPPLHSTFGFQLLDAALGERGVMDGLGAIDFGNSDDMRAWGLDPEALRPLTELPATARSHGLQVEAPRT